MLVLARSSLFTMSAALSCTSRIAHHFAPRMSLTQRAHLGSATEQEASYTLDGGYAKEPAADGTGGWLAHRDQLDTPGSGPGSDWVREAFDHPASGLQSAATFSPGTLTHAPRILVLYGSLRSSSFSRRLAHECARLLELMGADVRVFNPRGLPVRDPDQEGHPKVVELRQLSAWSEGHVWVCPEMHGTITGVFKNQIDWFPLNTGAHAARFALLLLQAYSQAVWPD